jgi:hypothetical protein
VLPAPLDAATPTSSPARTTNVARRGSRTTTPVVDGPHRSARTTDAHAGAPARAPVAGGRPRGTRGAGADRRAAERRPRVPARLLAEHGGREPAR